jgi:hypothetical protein
VNYLKNSLNSAQNILKRIINSIFDSPAKDSKLGVSENFRTAKEEIERVSRDLAEATNKLEVAQWRVKEAESELNFAQIQFMGIKNSNKYLWNYATAANAAANAYQKATNIAEDARRGIDAQVEEVERFEIEEFGKSQMSWTLLLGIFVGFFVGIFLTSYIRRRRSLRRFEKSAISTERYALLNDVKIDSPRKASDIIIPKKPKTKKSVKKSSSIQKKKQKTSKNRKK